MGKKKDKKKEKKRRFDIGGRKRVYNIKGYIMGEKQKKGNGFAKMSKQFCTINLRFELERERPSAPTAARKQKAFRAVQGRRAVRAAGAEAG